MEKLTQQIAGAYIGAQVVWRGIEVPAYNVINAHEIINCRLILTPLSAISDEDAVGLAEMFGYDPVGKIVKCVMRYNQIELHFEYVVYRIVISQHIIDYLRSRNYDIGYMDIKSLIDAGIAISSLDKTETK